MININLVNWRARKTLILNRRFAVVVSAAVLCAIFITVFIMILISMQISTANEGIAYLDSQLKEVAGTLTQIKDIQAQKDSLLARRKTIETLQASRPLDVEIFDNIARVVPQGVVITQLVRKGGSLTISGNSDSNYNISVLMENAQRLPWVKLAKLGQLKSVDDDKSKQANNFGEKISFEINLTINSIGVDNAAPGN